MQQFFLGLDQGGPGPPGARLTRCSHKPNCQTVSAGVQAQRGLRRATTKVFLLFGIAWNTSPPKSRNLVADLQLRVKYCKAMKSYPVISSPAKYVAALIHLGPEPWCASRALCALCVVCAMDKDAFAKVLDNSLSTLRQQILEVLCICASPIFTNLHHIEVSTLCRKKHRSTKWSCCRCLTVQPDPVLVSHTSRCVRPFLKFLKFLMFLKRLRCPI